MDIIESVKMATTTLMANKLRSSLTMLGIIIGNASVIAMIGIGEGAQKYVSEQVNSLGPNLLFCDSGEPRCTASPRCSTPDISARRCRSDRTASSLCPRSRPHPQRQSTCHLPQ